MKKLKQFIITSIIMIPLNLTAQVIDYFPFSELDIAPSQSPREFNIFKMKDYGVGNNGFDSFEMFYNPKYDSSFPNLQLSISSAVLFPSRIYSECKITDSKTRFIPNLGITYKFRDFLFGLNYWNDFYLGENFSESNVYEYLAKKGWYEFSGEPLINAKNSVIQFSTSYNLGENYSISLGLLLNDFAYDINLNGESKTEFFKFNNDMLKSYQIISSLNYNDKNYSFYFLGKSQKSKNKLNIISPKNIDPIDKNSVISFPGLIGYGFQIKIFPVKISLEGAHEFMNFKTIFNNTNTIRNVFNNEYSLGINYSIMRNIQLGLLGSYYTKMDNGTGIIWDVGNYYEIRDKIIKMEKPFRIAFSINYKFTFWDFYFTYQYSKSKYILEKLLKTERAIEDYNQFLKAGMKLSL